MRYPILAVLAMMFAGVGCTRPPSIRHYQKDGMQFSYYSNWTIVKDAAVDGKPDVRAIHIEGPGNAVVSLICVPPSNGQTLEGFAAGVAQRRDAAIESKLSIGSFKAAEVSKGASGAITGTVAGEEQQGILQQFSIDVLGTQVPHEAKFYMVSRQRYKVMIMSQVSIASAAATHPGSELILRTLAID
ncbi:MAG TPA: hypothetical protein VFA71_00525 [Terriglobales bacterium]|nr:hypothetical protein [Terriglobales bacterium]